MIGLGFLTTLAGFFVGSLVYHYLFSAMKKEYKKKKNRVYLFVGKLFSASLTTFLFYESYSKLTENLFSSFARQSGEVEYSLYTYAFYGFLFSVVFYATLIVYMKVSSNVLKEDEK